MGVLRFPVERLAPIAIERAALQAGLAAPSRLPQAFHVLDHMAPAAAAFCARCAASIEFGAVRRGTMLYCSVECSIGDDRPA